jgi:hypothetical protein
MGRLLPLLALADLALVVCALIECLSVEEHEIRALPRGAWVLIILLFSPVGGIAWYVAGRPERAATAARARSGSQDDPARAAEGARAPSPDDGVAPPAEPGRVLAPDDDPEFLRKLSERNRRDNEDMLRAWEADLLRRERDLRRARERPAEEPPGDAKA